MIGSVVAPLFRARIAVESGDVSCERRLSSCLYQIVEGEGRMERAVVELYKEGSSHVPN